MLEAVTRFGGRVETDGDGNLVYVFEELQSTAGPASAASSSRGQVRRTCAPPHATALRPDKRFLLWPHPKRVDSHHRLGRDRQQGSASGAILASKGLPLERPWVFSMALWWQKLLVGFLGFANAYGVAWLTDAVSKKAFVQLLAQNGVGWIAGAVPFLQVRVPEGGLISPQLGPEGAQLIRLPPWWCSHTGLRGCLCGRSCVPIHFQPPAQQCYPGKGRRCTQGNPGALLNRPRCRLAGEKCGKGRGPGMACAPVSGAAGSDPGIRAVRHHTPHRGRQGGVRLEQGGHGAGPCSRARGF